MTTHVLIVDKNTFKKHLEYMFVGTGNNHPFLINNGHQGIMKMHHSIESGQALMVADCNRMRVGDFVIFYLIQTVKAEGGFFGLFRVRAVPFYDEKPQTYPSGLTKKLDYRALIEPYKVYPMGVTEWEALDEIRNIASPCQMLWSLMYRKLKGNRGNTMITLYEADRLINLIQTANRGQYIVNVNGYSYDVATNRIVPAAATMPYDLSFCSRLDISHRLYAKYASGKAHESHLQAFITTTIGTGACPSLDAALFNANEQVCWIGNEVSCGVGMQRMDVVVSTTAPNEEIPCLYVIELKDDFLVENNIYQMYRYIDWLSQYYIPNKPSRIIPVLLTKGLPGRQTQLPANIQSAANTFFSRFSGLVNMTPLKFIYYDYPQPYQISFYR